MERIVDLLTPAASLHHHGIGYAFDGVRLVATARSEGSEIPDEDTPHRTRTLVHVHAPAVGEQRLHVILARFRHEPVLPATASRRYCFPCKAADVDPLPLLARSRRRPRFGTGAEQSTRDESGRTR